MSLLTHFPEPCFVTTAVLANIRQGSPSREAPIARKVKGGESLRVIGVIAGDAVNGNPNWYQLEDGLFLWAGACSPLTSTNAFPQVQDISRSPPAYLQVFQLSSAFAIKLDVLLSACRSAGHDFRVAQGLRTPETQARYYCQWNKRSVAMIEQKAEELIDAGAPWLGSLLRCYSGIERTPRWLTNALPGEGWHQWGEAADCYCFRNGRMVEKGDDPAYRYYAEQAQNLGLTAGLYFSDPDAGHVQLRSASSATSIYSLSHIDATMRERFSDKPHMV